MRSIKSALLRAGATAALAALAGTVGAVEFDRPVPASAVLVPGADIAADLAAINHAAAPAVDAGASHEVAGIGATLDHDALDVLRGGDSSTTNEVEITGGVNGNGATNVVTGTNSIDGGAFGNAAGISTVIQNSGANVLIQNGTVVNVQFVGPTP